MYRYTRQRGSRARSHIGHSLTSNRFLNHQLTYPRTRTLVLLIISTLPVVMELTPNYTITEGERRVAMPAAEHTC